MNRFLAASVIGLILLAILATGVYFYQRYSIILLDPMRAVPADAAVILEVKNPAEAFQDFFSGPLYKNINDDHWLEQSEKNYLLFDSLLKEIGDVSEIWEDQSLVISTHLVKAGTFDFLYLINLPRGWTEQKLKRFIEEGWKMPDRISKREYENVNIYESRLNDSTIFTFASSKSVAIFSISPLLVEQAIRQLKDGNGITLSKAFLKVVPPAYKKASIQIYFNNQSLKDIATSLSPDYNNAFFKMVASMARWNGFTAGNDGGYLTLTGSTSTFDTTGFLSFFRNQKSQSLNVSVIAPNRSALVFEFGLSNFPEYYNHLKNNSGFSMPESERKKVLSDLNEKFSVSFEPAFSSWTGTEMALIITEPAANYIDNNIYVCVKAGNPSEGIAQLDAVRDAVAHHAGLIPSEEKYREHIISTINVSGVLPLIYGKLFSGINGCSYTMINGYIIFSNNTASLKSFIDENEEAKVLSKDELFRNSFKRMGTTGNARLYLSPQLSVNLYRPTVLQSFLSTLYSSSGIHMQWEYKGTNLNSQILFDFHKKTMKDPVLFWSVQLDTVLSSVPVTIEESGGKTFVYIQDEKNTLYKLDESGRITWKKNMEEKILSELFPVDIYHDGRKQILFNTSSKLFLLDTDGNNAGHYPIRLPATATNGCSVIATPTSYNFYVACSNHYVYAYEAGGKPVVDWNYLRTVNFVSKPVQTFTINRNSYLVINQDSGTVIITDRKGNLINSFEGKFIQSENAMSFLFDSDSTGKIKWVTTDTSGNTILFSSDGTINKLITGKFTSLHQFRFINPKGADDFSVVYVDESQLTIFSNDRMDTIRKDLSGFNALQSVIDLPDGSNGMLLSAQEKDGFIIKNSKGETPKGFPLKGSINPVMAEFSRSVIICGGLNGMLYCYRTE